MGTKITKTSYTTCWKISKKMYCNMSLEVHFSYSFGLLSRKSWSR
jgi:hypothetical protein